MPEGRRDIKQTGRNVLPRGFSYAKIKAHADLPDSYKAAASVPEYV